MVGDEPAVPAGSSPGRRRGIGTARGRERDGADGTRGACAGDGHRPVAPLQGTSFPRNLAETSSFCVHAFPLAFSRYAETMSGSKLPPDST